MLRDSGMTVLNQVLVGSLQVLNFLVVLFVTPVVAFYLLLDWDRMVARVNAWLPREHALTIRGLAREIDVVLAGFVRGQLSVCVILGVFYAAALWAIGLQYGVLVGLIAGLISFIPYIGSTVGLLLSVGIALFQFWDAKLWIVVTAGIFLFGQFVEGNILAPNLIGKSVGLHPVWLILALAVFGSLFGFAGLLVAVPVAAALGVRRALSRRPVSRQPDVHRPGAAARGRALSRPEQLVLDLPTRPALGRAAFFVAPANRLALALVDSWPGLARRAARGDRAGGVGQDPSRPRLGGAGRRGHPRGARRRRARPRDPAGRRGGGGRGRRPARRPPGAAGGGRGGALPPVQPPRRRRRQPDGERAAGAGAVDDPAARPREPDGGDDGGEARGARRRPARRRCSSSISPTGRWRWRRG